MPYFSLRLTLGEIFSVPDEKLTNEHTNKVQLLLKHLIKEKINTEDDYVLGIERLNKYGEKTRLHYHFNFFVDDTKETLRKCITRKVEELEYKLKGNKMYCLTSFPEPKDYHRWFRYCLKENYSSTFTRYKPDKNSPTLEQLVLLAKDERKQTVANNLTVRNKQLDKRTYFDKIVKHLEKMKELKTHKEIYIAIARYYVEDGKPVNAITIKGYTNNYMLMKKFMTFEEFYDLNNYN